MSDRKIRATALVLAGMLLLVACGSKQNPTPQQAAGEAVATPAPAPASTADAPPATPDASGPAAGALREFRDPVTGELRAPTAAEQRAMAAARPVTPSASATSRPREIVMSNGTVAVELNQMSEMQGCVQPDGSVVADHDCKEKPATPVKKP
jgi:hypothetical protein